MIELECIVVVISKMTIFYTRQVQFLSLVSKLI